MKVIKTNISDVVILEPRVFGDERGYFFESFSQREFNEQVAEVTFVQDNESKSSYGVVRGLHYQLPPYTQAKLVRVVEGEVLDEDSQHVEGIHDEVRRGVHAHDVADHKHSPGPDERGLLNRIPGEAPQADV